MITSVNAFPFGCPYKRCAQPQDSIKILARPATKGWLGRYKKLKKLFNHDNFMQKYFRLTFFVKDSYLNS